MPQTLRSQISRATCFKTMFHVFFCLLRPTSPQLRETHTCAFQKLDFLDIQKRISPSEARHRIEWTRCRPNVWPPSGPPIGTQGLQMLPSRLLIFDMPRRRDAPPLRMTCRTSCRRRLTITLQVRPSDCCCQGPCSDVSHRVEFFIASISSSTWREVEAFIPKVRVYLKEPPLPHFNAMLLCSKK